MEEEKTYDQELDDDLELQSLKSEKLETQKQQEGDSGGEDDNNTE